MSVSAAPELDLSAEDVVLQARSLLAGGQAAEALSLLHPLLDGPQDTPAALDCAAMCCWDLGFGENALTLMEMINAQWPDVFDAWTKASAMAASLGQKDKAIDALKTALSLKPRAATALVALNRLSPFKRDSAQVRHLRDLSRSDKLPVSERVMVLNALGRVEERAGNFKPAFRHFTASKALSTGVFDPDATDALVRAQIADFQSRGDDTLTGPRMTFIVGLPRSGTTLLENILSRHPDVCTIGESKALSTTLVEARRYAAAKFGDAKAYGWVRHLQNEHVAAFQVRFLEHIGFQNLPPDKMIVDKMPLDCLDIGFASWILPNARFVFLQRHPLDVGLSNFCTNFFETNAFSRKLEWIGRMTRAVYRSAQDYEEKLGQVFRRQSYQALVEAPELEIRAILSHLGLPWDAACLTPEDATGAARTASMYQVREAINRKGLNKWCNYEEQLEPLTKALGGTAWISEWAQLDASVREKA
jgi:tetratricopeptide (TPR) repeat protein